MTDASTSETGQPNEASKGSGTTAKWKWAVGILLIVALPFGVRSCFIASGAYHHDDAPAIKFVGAIEDQVGEPVFEGAPSFELVFDPLDDRRAFVEILSDAQYETKSKESYVGGWGAHQGSWGGEIVDAKIVVGRSVVELHDGALQPGKHWIRSALSAGNTYREGESQFDRVIYGLVGKPIDYKGGSYFLNEGGLNRRYYASRYYPFHVRPGAVRDGSPAAGAKESVVPSLTVGVFTFDVPSGWEAVSGSDRQAAKREVEAGVTEMVRRFESAGQPRQGDHGIEAFEAIRMPNRVGWLIAYTVRIPPQTDYLTIMEKDQEQKLAWGREQGIVARVIERGRVSIGSVQVLKVDIEMRQGARSIGIYHWSPKEPGLVGTISVVVNPGGSDDIEKELQAILESLRIATH